MLNRSGLSSSNSKRGLAVKRSPSSETQETYSLQVNKKFKSFNLDEDLINLLCEVDKTFISKLHTFNNKSDIYKYLRNLDQELDNQLNNKTNSEDRKQNKIKELHRYNELKDATQSVIGIISSLTGESITELHKKFEVYDTE